MYMLNYQLYFNYLSQVDFNSSMNSIRKFCISSLLLATAFLPTQASAQTEQTCSNLLGRVQEEGGGYRGGETFCSGDQISPNSTVQFLCFSSGLIVTIEEATTLDSSICDGNNRANQPTCDRQGLGRFGCFISKAPEESTFQVLRPDMISGPRPDIEWEQVPEAQSYTVQIMQSEVIWSRTVASDTTGLAYPQSAPSLVIGETYDVIITANVNGQITASASRPINVNQITASKLSVQLAARMNEAQ